MYNMQHKESGSTIYQGFNISDKYDSLYGKYLRRPLVLQQWQRFNGLKIQFKQCCINIVNIRIRVDKGVNSNKPITVCCIYNDCAFVVCTKVVLFFTFLWKYHNRLVSKKGKLSLHDGSYIVILTSVTRNIIDNNMQQHDRFKNALFKIVFCIRYKTVLPLRTGAANYFSQN